MNTHTGQVKTAGEIKINFAYTSSYGKPCLKHTAMGGNTKTFINNGNTELNPGMIEVFYFRLLPVTCRDWMQK